MALRQRVALLIGAVVLAGALVVALLPYSAGGTSCGTAAVEWQHAPTTVEAKLGAGGRIIPGSSVDHPCRAPARSRLVSAGMLGATTIGVTALAVALLRRDEDRISAPARSAA